MSLLAPLYLLGGLAIALPILVHLIRRRPKAQVEFSSLMFLRESPPQLTKRSRLDDWPLLLMRALAIGLLAIAFARPFWRSEETQADDSVGRRLVLVVDTSASMQRTGITAAVAQRINGFVDELEPADAVAVVMFDETPRVVVDFDQTTKLEFAARRELIRGLAKDYSPTWLATHLGSAIAFAADHGRHLVAESKFDGDEAVATDNSTPVHLVVVSDFQVGSNTGALQSHVWGEGVTAELWAVETDGSTNVSMRLLRQDSVATSDATPTAWKVRVQNVIGSKKSQFQLFWCREDGSQRRFAAASVQVPAGSSRVVGVELPQPGENVLVIDGDDQPFDNTVYAITPKRLDQTLVYIGDEVSELAENAGHYLKMIPLGNAQRSVDFVSRKPSDDLASIPGSGDVAGTPMVVVATPLSSDQTSKLDEYIQAGGHVLAVMSKGQSDVGWTQTLRGLLGEDVTVSEADVSEYAIWSSVDFRDPLFSLMADPQYSDFSNLRFWSHRSLELPSEDDAFDVVVRFDDGDAAIVRRSIAKGRLTMLMAGWQPSESQLALSTKFIPLVHQLFDPVAVLQGSSDRSVLLRGHEVTEWVGDHVGKNGSGTTLLADVSMTLKGPWGNVELKGDEKVDRPGVLRFTEEAGATGGGWAVAINLVPDESDTEVMDPAMLESLGVVLGRPDTDTQRKAKQTQLRDVQLEDNQGWWQWILAATLGMLAVETVWSGRKRRGNTAGIGNAKETDDG